MTLKGHGSEGLCLVFKGSHCLHFPKTATLKTGARRKEQDSEEGGRLGGRRETGMKERDWDEGERLG